MLTANALGALLASGLQWPESEAANMDQAKGLGCWVIRDSQPLDNKKGQHMKSIRIMGACLIAAFATNAVAADGVAELDRRMDHWRTRLPFCNWPRSSTQTVMNSWL